MELCSAIARKHGMQRCRSFNPCVPPIKQELELGGFLIVLKSDSAQFRIIQIIGLIANGLIAMHTNLRCCLFRQYAPIGSIAASSDNCCSIHHRHHSPHRIIFTGRNPYTRSSAQTNFIDLCSCPRSASTGRRRTQPYPPRGLYSPFILSSTCF